METLKTLLEIKDTSTLKLFLGAFGIFVTVILLTRIFGKRSFSKMSSADFAMTIAIGSIIATTIMSHSISLLEGAIGLSSVYVLQVGTAFLRRFSWFQKSVDNDPLLLMRGDEILHENLKKSFVTIADLRSKLREANVTQLDQVKAVIFEATGDISVLHKNDTTKVSDWIMEDVRS